MIVLALKGLGHTLSNLVISLAVTGNNAILFLVGSWFLI